MIRYDGCQALDVLGPHEVFAEAIVDADAIHIVDGAVWSSARPRRHPLELRNPDHRRRIQA